MRDPIQPSPRGPIRPVGILFALAINIFLVSLTLFVAGSRGLDLNVTGALLGVAAVAAGIATALYVPRRPAIHAFIGGALSIPLIALFVLEGNWRFAILAGAFCALGGIAGEFWRRRRTAI